MLVWQGTCSAGLPFGQARELCGACNSVCNRRQAALHTGAAGSCSPSVTTANPGSFLVGALRVILIATAIAITTTIRETAVRRTFICSAVTVASATLRSMSDWRPLVFPGCGEINAPQEARDLWAQFPPVATPGRMSRRISSLHATVLEAKYRRHINLLTKKLVRSTLDLPRAGAARARGFCG